MTKPRKKVKSLPRTGALGDAGIRLGVQYVGEPEEEIPDRVPVVPPRLDTRSPDECRELVRRHRAGEDLGLSDRFLEEWG